MNLPTVIAVVAVSLAITFAVRILLFKALGFEGTPTHAKAEAQARSAVAPKGMRLLEQLGSLFSLPESIDEGQQSKLLQAGLRFGLHRWRGVQLVCGAGGVLLASAILVQSRDTTHVFLAVVVLVLGFFGPPLLLTSLARDRKRKLDIALASTLELLSVAVRSGYPLERGIKLIGQTSTGPLAEEFKQVDTDINLLGMGLEQALNRMKQRCATPAINAFTTALIQAHKQGVSVSRVLDSQARLARNEHYARLKEQVSKLPAKLVAPIFVIMMLIVVIALVPPIYETIQVFAHSYSNTGNISAGQTSILQR